MTDPVDTDAQGRARKNTAYAIAMRARSEELFWRKVEKTTGCWLWTGTLLHGYGQMKRSGRTMLVHRFSYELAFGPVPKGRFIDHTCFNRACVRPEHLRLVSSKQNNEHLAGAHRDSKSGIRGVSWDSRRGLWAAAVTHNYRKYHAGYHGSIETAAAAVQAKRAELFTHDDGIRA